MDTLEGFHLQACLEAGTHGPEDGLHVHVLVVEAMFTIVELDIPSLPPFLLSFFLSSLVLRMNPGPCGQPGALPQNHSPDWIVVFIVCPRAPGPPVWHCVSCFMFLEEQNDLLLLWPRVETAQDTK